MISKLCIAILTDFIEDGNICEKREHFDGMHELDAIKESLGMSII